MIRTRLLSLLALLLVATGCKGLDKNVRATGVRRVQVQLGNSVSALIEFADEGGTYESWKEIPDATTTPQDQEEAELEEPAQLQPEAPARLEGPLQEEALPQEDEAPAPPAVASP